MSDFDRFVQESLRARGPEWDQRAEAMKGSVQAMYEEKRKQAALLSWIGSGIGMGFMLLGIANLLAGMYHGNASVAVAGAMFFLFGDGWMTGSKMLYWTWNSRLQIQRDLKEMHYDVMKVLERVEAMEAKLDAKG